MTMTVGVVGVGTMGEPMARNLLRAGFEVVVSDRSPEAMARMVETGAKTAATPAEVAAAVEVLICSLPDDAAVEEVLAGHRGVADSGAHDLIVVDTSTISPQTSIRLAAMLAGRGITLLDGPVSGGQSGAQAGTLAIMVGGPQPAYERALPVLRAIGQHIRHIGENGAALVIKLANNLICGAIMAATSEAMTMTAAAGLDPGLVHDVLVQSTCRGFLIENVFPDKVLDGHCEPGFRLALQHKDMGLALDCGKGLCVPMYVSALVHQLYTQALGMGKGDLDCWGIADLYAEGAGGLSLRRRGVAAEHEGSRPPSTETSPTSEGGSDAR